VSYLYAKVSFVCATEYFFHLKPSELAVAYCLAPSTICTIISNKDKILQYFEQNKIDETSKRIRHSNFNNIEDAMMMWFNQTMLNKNITLDGNILKAQAIKFATYFQETNFVASNGWLDGFKKRNNISFRFHV
jgi:hypothetical protein